VIRPMHRGDVPSVVNLCDQLGYHVTAEELEARMGALHAEDGHLLLVAEVGVVVGWVHARTSQLLTDPAIVEIAGLVVSDTARGLGTGRSLVVAVEQWAWSLGLSQVQLRSNVKRRKAHKFYEALGYRKVKRSEVFVKALE